MADAAVSFAIDKLGNFLIHEANIRVGVKDGIIWLKEELGYLQSSLRDAEEKQVMDTRVSLWINSIRDVADLARITVDRFSIIQEELAAEKNGVMDRLLSYICICKKEVNLYKIGKEIVALKGRVVEIKKRRDEYKIDEILARSNLQKRKRTLLRATSFENIVDMVGFKDDFRTLLTKLVSEDPSLGIISIHGMGGLGKTTLASKLYHSSELSCFQSRAWVCVSKEYNIKDVLEEIIKSFMGHEQDSLKRMNENDLLRELRNLLQDRGRYLVVIDDIWDIDVWEKIKKVFPDKQNGSRVIITTRNQVVAQRVDDRCFVYPLRCLMENESWELFCKRAKPTKNQEELGKEMVHKCQGLPLAIVVLSGLLLHKTDWSDVKNHLWRNLKMESSEIHEILTLSYDDLSPRMKHCFLYLARYPEDQTFRVKDLMLLWIAEEFITEADEGDGVVMEDLAEDCLNELINRNMIQVTGVALDGEVLECRMHDLVRDLATQKATENKLIGIFDSSKQHGSPNNLVQGQSRHAVYSGIGEYLKSLVRGSDDDLRLCSLAVFSSGSDRAVKLEETKLMFTRFKYLKVVDLRNAESDIIPEEIGDLVFLKFLGLIRGLNRKTLVIPPTVGKLKKLQTLCSFFGTWYEVPKEICEIKELRHLQIASTRGSLSLSSHQIKLQTLYNIWFEDWMKIDTVNFSNLHTLGILFSQKEGNDACSLDSVASLTSLHTLSMSSLDLSIANNQTSPVLQTSQGS